MKYFIYQLRTDKGPVYFKTAASTLDGAINNIMLFENCPKQAITIYEVGNLWNMNTKKLFAAKEKELFNSIF